MVGQSNLLFRSAVAILLIVALGGLLVGAGALLPGSSEDHYPGNRELAEQPESHVGEQVIVSGRVIETDPVVIRASGTDQLELTLRDFDDPVEMGDLVSVFGIYQGEGEVTVKKSLSRAPWEAGYMFAVSILGGAWVLTRVIRYWSVDLERLVFVPRGEQDG